MGIIYFTYSKFTVTNKFNVVNAKVGSFTTTPKINYYADGTQVSTIPSSASYKYSTSSCDSGATYSFNEATWTGTTTTYYGAYIRNITKKTPILTCANQSDRFTVSDSSKGNAKLTYPIGLITADEITMAGGVFSTTNSSYYLYNNQNIWTMTPTIFNGSYAYETFMLSTGTIGGISVSNAYGLRPVINLKSDTLYTSGLGTSTSPYIIS